MHTIKCSLLTDTACDFVTEGETKEEVKSNFYQHGVEIPMHQEAYLSATDEERAVFGKKIDEYLAKQN